MTDFDEERIKFEKQFEDNEIVYNDLDVIQMDDLLKYTDNDFLNSYPVINRFINNQDEIEIGESGKLLRKYLEYYGPGSKNIELFNNWICKTFYNNVHGKTIKLNLGDGYFIRFENPKIIPPCYIKNGIRIPLTPQYCRLNSKTYDILTKCTMVLFKLDPNKGEIRLEPSVPLEIGKIPIVVKSRVCTLYGKNEEELEKYGEDPNDPGGYYIIKGKEKTIIFQEQIAFNKISLYKMKGKICCRINCLYAKIKSTTLFQLSIDEKLKMIEVEFTSITRKVDDKSGNEYNVTCNVIRILRVLGVGRGVVKHKDGSTEIIKDKCKKEFRDLLIQFIPKEYINECMNKLLMNFSDSFIGYEGTEEDGYTNDINEIFKKIKTEDNKSFDKKEEFVLKKLNENILPQVYDIPPMNNEKSSDYEKRVNKYRTDTILSMIANVLLYVAGYITETNRDSWANKKTEGTGRMQELLFKSAFHSAISEASKFLLLNKGDFTNYNETIDTFKLLNSFHTHYSIPDKKNSKSQMSKVTKTFLDSFISPTWGVKGKDGGKSNVVQILNRDSVAATFAHLDTIDVNIPRNTQQANYRKIQDDQYGGICSISSSEGETCGLVKVFCSTARLSLDRLDIPLIYQNYIYKKKWLNVKETKDFNHKFSMNGVIMGWCNGDELYNYLIDLRRSGMLPFDVTLIKYDNIMGSWVHVDTSPSRVIRPLLIVKDGKLVIDEKGLRNATIEELINKGCIEYVSMWEQQYIKLASEKKIVEDLNNDIMRKRSYIEDYENKLKKLKSKNLNYDEYKVLVNDLNKLRVEYDTELLIYEDDPKKTDKIKSHFTKEITSKETKLNKIREKNLDLEEIEALENKLRDENNFLKILLRKEPYTHCEIDPLATIGIVASLIPMPNHCQAPRNAYQNSMAKQALANPHTNSINRFDGKTKRLSYPTRPFVETETSSILGLDKKGSGFMATLAFLAFPYTEEDAFIFKREFIQAGGSRMYKSITFVSSLSEPSPGKQTIEKFMRPNNIKHDQLKRYTYIQENGLPCIGAPLKPKDCVIGKVSFITNTKIENQSTFLKIGEEGVVEKVYVSGDTVKVKIAITRIPVIGDKFSPRNAQKATIGYILDEKDMPFCEDTGITPDIITNPHQIPTRMTLSYPLELIYSKSAAYHAKRVNGTAFRYVDLAEVQNNLESRGLLSNGTQQMRSGITGKKFDIKTYIGPVFMQALKHHPIDKIQARSTGAKKALTRQPQGGRNKNGGIRWGEMERDAATAWGASSVVQERLCYVSDAYNMVFCRKCSEYGLSRTDLTYKCPMCKEDHNNFGKKTIPWVATLLSRLLGAAGIRLQFDLEFNDETKNRILKNPINTIDYNEIENLDVDDREMERMAKIEGYEERDTSDDFINDVLN